MFNPLQNIFGWQFKKTADEKKVDAPYIKPSNEDSSYTIASQIYGRYAHALNYDESFKNENEVIKKYRNMSMYPEADSAITDIVNESIYGEHDSYPVTINLDDVEGFSENIQEKIKDEFQNILKLLNFNIESYDIFRKWYVDGRLYFYIVIDENKTSNGIKELRYISPYDIKKVREEKEESSGGIVETREIKEYYVYSPRVSHGHNVKTFNNQGIVLTKDSVCYVHSGIYSEESSFVLGNLHKIIKIYNQLSMMEDALIVYRLSRAPERRVFNVDVGMMKTKNIESYMKNLQRQFANKLVYDTITGEMKDAGNAMSILEDYWFPKMANGRGSDVTTLAGGQNLGELDDVEYFQKKLYMGLNVPISRMASLESSIFNVGRSAEITRDELKFSKFISRLRKRFSHLFYKLLRTQLILKKIITEDDWEKLEEQIRFNFANDMQFAELKDIEILRERINIYRDIEDLIGKHFSKSYVRKKILRMTDEEIEQMQNEIEQEKNDESDTEPDNEDSDLQF